MVYQGQTFPSIRATKAPQRAGDIYRLSNNCADSADAQVIEPNPPSYPGHKVKHAAQPKPEIPPQLRPQYVNPSEVEDAIRQAIHAHLKNAPLRLLNTSTGRLCDREAQINAFMKSTELLSSSMLHAPLQTEPIKEAVAKYFGWVMLSHKWEGKEPLLHDIQEKDVYTLDPVGTMVKLQTFCQIARDAGHLWAWSDTCCIDIGNKVEVQEVIDFLVIWFHYSALTIVYLFDVRPSSKFATLTTSSWNNGGWTIQEFLAPDIVLFYQADWTLYLDDRSPNHKQSVAIMQEFEHSTGINAQTLVALRLGMTDAREKLQWASTRATNKEEDIAYSLFGIFGVYLPFLYGEKKQNALGWLSQEIIARSGNITVLDWVGRPSEFNSCLPADITSYQAPPSMLPSLSEYDIQKLVPMLPNTVTVRSASKMYTLLDRLSAPRFAHRILQLPCIAFPVTEVKRRRSQNRESCFTYGVKADGLQNLPITTEENLTQFSRDRPTQQTFLLIRLWNRYDLGLPDFEDDESVVDRSSDRLLSRCSRDDEPADLECHSRALRLIARLGQPFGALLLARQRDGKYKRIASDNNIIAQVRDVASIHDMMDVRTLEIL
ncbi:hypothetical protein DFH29DRAFT_491556 [Suillus ampliporus]|nr:hypothetical protein DFH29DRAFT_491556 [Suillus ampliporus]